MRESGSVGSYMRNDLLLQKDEKMSDEKPVCPKLAGVLYGKYHRIETDGEGFGATLLNCGRWDCPVCRERKAKELLARSLRGGIVAEARRAGFREQYNFKFLTLTVPGREWRAVNSPQVAAEKMRDAFANLIKSLRKTYGDFAYLRVLEAHKTGYPHYHVLLVGAAIAPKHILDYIRHLWIDLYGMGFVDLQKVEASGDQSRKAGIEDAIRYLIKYLFKKPVRFGSLRLFSASSGAIAEKKLGDRKYDWFTVIWTRGRGIGAKQTIWIWQYILQNQEELNKIEDEWIDAMLLQARYGWEEAEWVMDVIGWEEGIPF